MRLGRLLLALAPLTLAVPSASYAQDFDPHGRHRHPAAPSSSAAGSAGVAHPASPARPSQDELIARYTRIALAQPGASFPLQRLAQLYRARDGHMAKLIADFEARAAAAQGGPGQYAATVALAGMEAIDGRVDDATAAYERAILLETRNATAYLALGRLLQDHGDLTAARGRYEEAAARQTAPSEREQTLRTLMTLALDQKDWAGAKRFHEQIEALEPSSLFVKAELGHELFNRGEYARAEPELKLAVGAASGDNRALAPALKDLGQAQAKEHKNVEALATLERALAATAGQSALRAEIYAVVAEVYRADQRLPVLIEKLEHDHPSDFARLSLLGSLYEETGSASKAIAAYERALAVEPTQIDLRLRMIRLLQAEGDLDKAIAEYASLIRAAPDNPQFVFEECDALLQRGERARALKLIADLEARAQGDEEVLSRVADFYGRIDDREGSLRVLQRLARTAHGDPGHIVDLGDRYYQDGNTKLAIQTWKQILGAVQPRARALAALGDVYMEHTMTGDALAAYKEAIALDPANLTLKRSLADAYERTHNYREARSLYEEVIAGAEAKGDNVLTRECRVRIVTLWGLEGVLEAQLPRLARKLSGSPPDLEAGRTLAEAELHLRRLPDTERTLRRLIALAPGDAESYLALERVLVQEGKVGDAIATLARLTEVDPHRARELYERMAQYALRIYHDDDAIRYATRAVELNPDDAEGHRRLGEMYRSRQDVDHAIAEFRSAIAKNDRLFVVYFELADLLLSKGQPEDADRLFRRVVRSAPDDDLVARAARLSMQINLGKGTLEALDQDLLPLAISFPQRPVYRRLLVEIYGSLTFGLVQRVRHGTPAEAADARAALTKIGARAVKPLLDSLADADAGQQRIAIDVLSYVRNEDAALPLFAFATGSAEPTLRARAMIACGALSNSALVPKYGALLFPRGGTGEGPDVTESVALAAVWGLARMQDPKVIPLLRRIARGESPAMRALAVLGLGVAHDRASIADVAAIAAAPDAGGLVRAAAAYALGELDAEGEAPMLVEMAGDGGALARRMAIAALARILVRHAAGEPRWQADAIRAMADAVFVGDQKGPGGHAAAAALAHTAVAAMAEVARGTHVGPDKPLREVLPAPDGALDVGVLLDHLAPPPASSADAEAALVRFAQPIERAALTALHTSEPQARAVLDAFGDGGGKLTPFVPARAAGPAADAARMVYASLEPSLVSLVRHPDAALRTRALVLLAHSRTDGAMSAVVAGIRDPDPAVRRVALAAIDAPDRDGRRAPPSADAVAAVEQVLTSGSAWAMRALAAQAMGRLGAAGAGMTASRALIRAAGGDGYALVRQSALEALASFDTASARVLATRVSANDPEPRVRDAARAIAAGEAPRAE